MCKSVCVCVAKEAVRLATDQLLLSSQRSLNRDIFVASRSGAACKRGSRLCRWYRGSCWFSCCDLILANPVSGTVCFKTVISLWNVLLCFPNEKCWKCSNRSKLDWCCFAECHHPHGVFRNLYMKTSCNIIHFKWLLLFIYFYIWVDLIKSVQNHISYHIRN